jgi:small subunit ribosomal protein S20
MCIICGFIFSVESWERILPNITSAKKRVRQAEKSRQHNKHIMSGMRTCVKNVLKAITAGDKELAQTAYCSAVSSLDATASKGLIHKNKAARHKSRLNKAVRTMSA